MNTDTMAFYGLNKRFDDCGYFETGHYQNILHNIKNAIGAEGITVLTGRVGSGKTVMLRQIQHVVREENKILLSKSLAMDKPKVTIHTLCRALFEDLVAKRSRKFPMQAGKLEHKLQAAMRGFNKPVALFVDDAHDIPQGTLLGLKHLLKMFKDAQSSLAIVIAGQPKLKNNMRDLQFKKMGARINFFELNTLADNGNGAAFVEWIISNCIKNKSNPHEIVSKEAVACLAENLTTPLQMTAYLTRALEKGSQVGEMPLGAETVKTILPLIEKKIPH